MAPKASTIVMFKPTLGFEFRSSKKQSIGNKVFAFYSVFLILGAEQGTRSEGKGS
jgi:hypothetical protein